MARNGDESDLHLTWARITHLNKIIILQVRYKEQQPCPVRVKLYGLLNS